jgi:hypothetical protein
MTLFGARLSALAQGVVVVPASVQGADIPPAQELPPSLAPLTRRQGFQLSDTGWRDDVERLIRRLEAAAEEQSDHGAAADSQAPPRRARPSARTLAAAALGFLILLAALAGVLLFGGDGEGGGDSRSGASPAAPLPSGVDAARGTVALGIDLRLPPSEDPWYCTGSGADSPSCAFVLTRLPEVDRPVKAPFDGVVTRWRVQGAGGRIRLIVVRGELKPGGRSNLQRVQGSAEQAVRDEGRQTFRTRLQIRRGDAVGLQFSIGAYGNAPYSQGTWLEEWIPPLGAERRRSNNDSEYEYELLYNASIERDKDRDGFGDATQDDCPEDPNRQEGC